MRNTKTDIKMISENYSLSKDRSQWILTEHYKGKDKDGNDTDKARDSYHSNLKQIANYLVDNSEHHDLDSYITYAENIKSDIKALLINQ